MKYAALLLCCLMSCDCAHVVDVRYTNISPKQMYDKIEPLTWEIVIDYGNGLVGECLGTPINMRKDVMILTAHHCVEKPAVGIHIKPITEDPRKFMLATVHKSNKVFDLALLKPIVPIPRGRNTMLASTPPRRLDPYYQLRYETTKRERLLFYSGHVVRIERDAMPLGSAMLSGLVPKGTSGGPIFNLRGDLICVQTRASYCTSTGDVFLWLKSIGE